VSERRAGISRREFIERMPEGEGAGPGAPETAEPTQGAGSARGPNGPAMRTMLDEGAREGRTGEDDAHHDVGGGVATGIRHGWHGLLGLAFRLARRGRPGA